ncbi:LamG-like jellyroll fold domain-containing protein [Luteimicrobium sp. DT211]|uniref:LamG-like jellyroll fold domain-containing protein n=1 Tax=Luteimicrobium sp. DT211 TaxID=3393412 RepID=UPI003CF64D0C
MTSRPVTRSWRRLAATITGLAVAGTTIIGASVADAVASETTPTSTGSTPPQADVLDVDFADGTPTDHAAGREAHTVGRPAIALDPQLNRVVPSFDGGIDAYWYDLSDAWDSSASPNLTTSVSIECDFRFDGDLPASPASADGAENDVCAGREGGGYAFYVPSGKSALVWSAYVGGAYKTVTSPELTKGDWYHVVGTYDGTSLKLYVDGALAGSGSYPGTVGAPSATARGFVIGGDVTVGPSAQRQSPVTVAATRIFSAALDADQVAALADRSQWLTTPGTGATAPPPVVVTPPVVDGVPAADVLDVDFTAGSPVDHAQSRQPLRFGAPRLAVDKDLNRVVASFDGVDDGYDFAADDAWNPDHVPNLSKAYTVECTFRLDASLPVAAANKVCGGENGGGMSIYVSGSSLAGEFYVDGAYHSVKVPAASGVWQDVVAQYDGSSIRLYVNGKLVKAAAQTGTATGPSGAKFLGIGADQNSGGSSMESWSKATVASERIWDSALTAHQIALLAGATSAPVEHAPKADVLDVDLSDGTYTDDAAGRTPDVTGSPVVSTDVALDKSVASFDGRKDGILYPLQDAWDGGSAPQLTTTYSTECVFRFDGTLPPAAGNKTCSGENTGGFGIIVNGSNVQADFYVAGAYHALTAPIRAGVWYDAVQVYDGATIKLYLNGSLAAQADQTGAPGAPNGTKSQNFVIGADTSSSGGIESLSASTISAARIWSTPLTAAQAAQLSLDAFGARQTDVALTSSVPAAGQKLTKPVDLAVVVKDQGAATGWTYAIDGVGVRPGQRVGAGLAAGAHALTIAATDVFGHPIAWTVPFTSSTIPTGGGTDTGQGGGKVTLSAIAHAPDGGEVTTTFKQAQASLASGGFQGTVPVVPSALDFTYDDAGTVDGQQAEDGKTATSPSSHEGMPFQRFDVSVPSYDDDRHVRWSGVVDPERSVSLRVWDTASTSWKEIATARGASDGDTALEGDVTPAEIDGDVVHVLVLALDPFADDLSARDASAAETANHFDDPDDYDFSFVHWTDPQFIAEGAAGGSGKMPTSPEYATSSGVETAEEQAVWATAYRDAARWTIANAKPKKIAYAAMTGDMINSDVVDPYATNPDGTLVYPTQLDEITKENAFASGVIDSFAGSGVPAQVIAGNHDDNNGQQTGSDSLFAQAFSAAGFYDQAKDWPAGASYHTKDETTGADGATTTQGEDSQDSYVLFSAGGLDFVAVGLSYGVTDEEADWANSIFQRYKDRNGILITHSYLNASSNKDGRDAAYTGDDGAPLYKKVVTANPNVFLVLAGHVHGVGTNLVTVSGPQVQHKVVELLADYQEYQQPASKIFTAENCPTCVVDASGNIDVDGDGVLDHKPGDKLRFGASFLRLLQFDTKKSTMSVDSYSPFFDEFGTHTYDTKSPIRYDGSEDNFTVPVDLTSRTTSFATDGLAVVTPTDTVIGTATGKSGFPVSVTWSGLTAGQPYAWTASSTDAAGDDLGQLDQFGGFFVASAGGTDVTPPVITLPPSSSVQQGEVFDPLAGVTAKDDTDGDVTAALRVTGTVDTAEPGTYTLIYSVSDANGNVAQAQRAVKVVAQTTPERTPTSVKASNVTVQAGKELTLTATVSPADATGTVTFVNGEEPLCDATVTAGKASCVPFRTPVAGTYAVSAQYLGDATRAPSDRSFVLTVTRPASTTPAATTVTGTATSWTYGTNGTVRVTVKGGTATPTGEVLVKSGSKELGWTDLRGGKGTVTLAVGSLQPGSRTLTLTYGGDTYHKASHGSLTVTVRKASAKAAVSVTKAPTSRAKGTARVTVSSAVRGLPSPTGKVTVTLKKGRSTWTATGTLSKGHVTVTLPKLAKGTWTLTTSYAGDSRFGTAKVTGKAVRVTR